MAARLGLISPLYFAFLMASIWDCREAAFAFCDLSTFEAFTFKPVAAAVSIAPLGGVFLRFCRSRLVMLSVNERSVANPFGRGPWSSTLAFAPLTNFWKTCFVSGSHQLT